ncbi:hypothetical protein HK100_003091 [Physocladia obscura]|uniref:Uncharacterized protein n=1 Tax=Physocladia obscura TaxID=109957 RepID=A0AAD5T8H1_9FUNG|nr:hypothetical protein HK100_003091 [Physocladia obscura]
MLKTADTNSHSCDEDGTGRADESNDGTSGGEAEAQADEIEAHSAPSNAANSVVEILDKHQRSARARRTNYAAFYALDPDAELDVNVSASSAPIESAQDSTKQQRNASRSSATSTKNKTNNSAPNNNNNSNPTVSGTIIANNYNYSSSKGSSSRAKQSPATKDRDRKDRASSDDLAQSTSVNSQTSDADNSVTGNDDGSITRCVCLLSQGTIAPLFAPFSVL